MQKFATFQVLLTLLLSGLAAGQDSSQPPSHPIVVSRSFFASQHVTPKHLASSTVSASTAAAVRANDSSIVTLPNFTRSFTFGGNVFPYTMIGQDPTSGNPTQIPTTYVPMSFVFNGFKDQHGNTITIDATAITNEIQNSPLFQPTAQPNGTLQFEDSVMRAEFFPLIGDNSDWHVLLNSPQNLRPATIEVPRGSAELFQDPKSGEILAIVDIGFLQTALKTLFVSEPISSTAIPIFITRNTVYATVTKGKTNFNTCCVGGFHNAFETSQGDNTFVQTFAFTTSLDSPLALFAFGDPGIFADVNPLSHELGELLNDPFVNNVVPRYEIPGLPAGVIACQSHLEDGDIIENFSPDYIPVTLNGFTYHPQTLALLQWFEGITPSDAFNAQYSFPAPIITTPFVPCPAGH